MRRRFKATEEKHVIRVTQGVLEVRRRFKVTEEKT